MHLLVVIFVAALTVLLIAVSFGVIDALHVQPRPKAAQKRVACVGDSITYGCFMPGQPWNSYPRKLGRLLGRGYCVGNFGYTNRTALKSGDYPYTAEKLYRQSLVISYYYTERVFVVWYAAIHHHIHDLRGMTTLSIGADARDLINAGLESSCIERSFLPWRHKEDLRQ